MFEVTFIESGKTFRWTKVKCEGFFGKDEFIEALAGYDPTVVIIEL